MLDIDNQEYQYLTRRVDTFEKHRDVVFAASPETLRMQLFGAHLANRWSHDAQKMSQVKANINTFEKQRDVDFSASPETLRMQLLRAHPSNL